MEKEISIDGTFEYIYTKEGDTHSLFYNNSDQWSEPTKGTLAMQITEVEDGYKISQETSQSKKNSFNCMEALQLTILFKLIYADEGYIFEVAEKSVF